MSRHDLRTAFTLVELLVVIAIIGILVALLLPAVQAAREAARRSQCANHLKQISLAIHEHIEVHDAFPTGGGWYGATRTMINNTPVSYEKQTWSWPYQLLPQIEQQNLYDHPDDDFVAGTPIPIFFCPSRRPPIAIRGGPWASRQIPRAQICYAGNAGSPDPQDDDPPILGGTGRLSLGKNGVLRSTNDYEPLTTKNVVDGMSKTILIGEKRLNFEFASNENQPGDNDGYVGGYQDDVVRWGYYPPEPDYGGPHLTMSELHPKNFQFGGPHPGVVLMVYCDGSIHQINYSIDPQAFCAYLSPK